MKKLAAIISASLLLGSTSAMADIYLGAKAGKTWLDSDACKSGAAYSCDDDDSTLGAFAGYKFNDYISLEAGYDYLGRFTGEGMDDDTAQAVTLAPKLSLPITDAIALYGKAGGAWVDYGSEDDWSYLGAAGLEFNTTENVTLRLEYQRLFDINNDIVRTAADTATLGVVYTFGGSKAEPVVVEEEPVVMAVEEPQPVEVTKYFETKVAGTQFSFDSTKLKPGLESTLDKLVAVMEEHPEAVVEITGYTDSTGPEAYNQKLSEKRAQSVADAVKARGIDESRIVVKGEGENNPVASNDTREGREQNRRVEIVVPSFKYTEMEAQ